MTGEAPNSLTEVRIHGVIGDDPESLNEIADAVVRGCSICYARVVSLRELIDAVQRHPDARLAPPVAIGDDDRTPPLASSVDTLSHLCIYGGVIDKVDCDNADVRIELTLSSLIESRTDEARFDQLDRPYEEDIGYKGKRPLLLRVNEITSGNPPCFSGACFTGASFGGDVRFEKTVFHGSAQFVGVRFFGVAQFSGAQFCGDAQFASTRFGGEARFDCVNFGDNAWFNGAQIVENAWFTGTEFKSDAWFTGTTIGGEALFAGVEFCRDAGFDGVRFGRKARFANTRFHGEALFRGTRFVGPVTGDLRPCTLRTATFAESADGPPRSSVARAFMWVRNWCSRSFGWNVVRSLGQLQVLSRISVMAIIVVPVLAALTTMLQAQLPHWPSLGTSLALAFFAAASVTLGLLIYQVFAPDSIRKHDEDEFVDFQHRRYPEDATDRNDGLRRAIEHLEVIALRRPDRHAHFVKHHGDTIWIPPREKIDWFKDWEPAWTLEDEMNEASIQTYEDARIREEEQAKRHIGIVPGAERARIAIEEGAKAEYWIKSRENVVMAWTSFALYGIGISILLCILILQSIEVGKAAGWFGQESLTVHETTVVPSKRDAAGEDE